MIQGGGVFRSRNIYFQEEALFSFDIQNKEISDRYDSQNRIRTQRNVFQRYASCSKEQSFGNKIWNLRQRQRKVSNNVLEVVAADRNLVESDQLAPGDKLG